MIRLKTTSSSSCGPLKFKHVRVCLCFALLCSSVALVLFSSLPKNMIIVRRSSCCTASLFLSKNISLISIFFLLFLSRLLIYLWWREAPLWWTQNFGVHLRPGPSSTRFNGGVTLPRISEYKRRKKGRQKKLLAAPVSRYLLLSFSFSNI
jgi:hypothetical protein